MLEVLEYIQRNKVDDEIHIINREISWLAFNARVLQEAEDPSNPLLERVRFLGIFSNNLDEFFRVRVATVKRMVTLKKYLKEIIMENPKELLAKIQDTVLSQQKDFQRIYSDIINELKEEGINLVNEEQLSEDQGAYVKEYFHQHVYPALVPIMLDDTNRFPTLRDASIYLAIKLSKSSDKKDVQYSILEVPSSVLPRFLVIPSISNKRYIIILDDIIRYCLREIYAILNYDVIEAYTIKITRDAELDLDSDVSKSFLEKMKKSLKKRKKAEAVRFIYDRNMPKDLLSYLMNSLDLDKNDNIIPGGRYHNFKDFMKFPHFDSGQLQYDDVKPLLHKDLQPYQSILDVIRKKDVLLHYPYQTFNYFISLLREAAIDPKVRSIKITVYRLAKRSKVVNALINAAKNGKRVTVILELQARFDEEANIKWSGVLRDEGVKVLFGMPGLKIHSKLCLIERESEKGTRFYSSIGTGNYNENTAELYSDLALFTSKQKITREIDEVFNFLEGEESNIQNLKHIVPSPMTLRGKLRDLIDIEIKNAKKEKEAYITLKMNSLVDPELIHKLYEASEAGVKIRLNVRGICSLVAGRKGYSENIEAISILDRFLEHSRVFIFANGGDEKIFISSADWMGRNLDGRVEVTCPIYDSEIRKEVNDFIDIQWNDNVKARILDGTLKNKLRKREEKDKPIRSQFELYKYYKGKLKEGR
ncbi:polyphosphate kinase 1 [Salibacter sp.]|uniref:polyphosphate kinase 1 n=1 Tax=Salibacter sp. TaxID=2010995 RepID=UPI00286FF9D0|nr:polyphosphate kinase 1 [Salibacter sp.]MDR9486978.1 polyphosphate kinase 1 [Salibacter sp.]